MTNKILTAYEYLKIMCEDTFIQESVYDSHDTISKISYRLNYIKSNIPKYELDAYNADQNTQGHNLYHFIDVGEESTIVFLAHHDVVNLDQQNCNDNTASCCHLIELTHRFNENIDKLRHNIVIAWVDHEELCNTKMAGSYQLAKRIKENKFGRVIGVLNLELTAVGDQYWMNPEGVSHRDLSLYLEEQCFETVNTPLNDAVHLARGGVSAICIGSYRKIDRDFVATGRLGCELWPSCHSNNDTIEKWAIKEDMKKFNDILYKTAINYCFVHGGI